MCGNTKNNLPHYQLLTKYIKIKTTNICLSQIIFVLLYIRFGNGSQVITKTKKVMMYYNDYQKNNCRLEYVRTHSKPYNNDDETEVWVFIDTDNNLPIGLMEYTPSSKCKSYTFTKHADVYGLQNQSFNNWVDVIKDFENNVEHRMYEGV